jgi:hypothetical protein
MMSLKSLAIPILLASALSAQTAPFTMTVPGVANGVSEYLGRPFGLQNGNLNSVSHNPNPMEQWIWAYTQQAGATIVNWPNYWWEPKIGFQIVIGTMARTNSIPNVFYAPNTYVPLIGMGANALSILSFADNNWNMLHIDTNTAIIGTPGWVNVFSYQLGYTTDVFYSTIDVPYDPTLIGTALWLQASRVDPSNSLLHLSRGLRLTLQS